MEPSTHQTFSKKTQYVITSLLGLILLTLIGGYIYYGMRQASIGDTVPVVVEPRDQSDGGEISREEKLAILQALSANAEATIPSAEREAILKSLESDTADNSLTEEQRKAILNGLQN